MKISNSKKELARIISENGGWREMAKFSAQDKDGDVYHFATKPTINAGHEAWHHKGCIGEGEFTAETLPNWHQTILSREEYFHLYPAQNSDGWIEWNGGECPVGEGDRIDVKFSDGDEFFDVGSYGGWGADAGCCNIIAYRLHKPEQADPEFCESVMRSIPGLGINSKNININITQVDDINVVESKPTIEQMASDYHNAKDYADRKQQEVDAAKADAEVKLKALELAGEAIGPLVSPITAKQKPELVITDWRDLQTGDLVWVEEEGGRVDEGEYEVLEVEVPDYGGKRTIRIRGGEGGQFWINYENGWRFIRRP